MSTRRLRSWGQLALGGALLLALWVLLVWVASRPALRTVVDLTPQQVNSVDPVTEDLLRELRASKAEIEFHLFYPSYPGQGADAEQQQLLRIRAQLRELTRLLLVRYQVLGGESVAIHAHDFYGDVDKTREMAQTFGYTAQDDAAVVVAVRMPGKERRFRKLSLLLDLGVIERPNPGVAPLQRGALPVLKRFVGEEQISSAIKSLLVEGTPVAYVLRDFSPYVRLDDAAGDSSYSLLLQSLQRIGFEVRQWESRTQPTVPEDAAIVLVLEPSLEFTDGVANALFEYVKRGGNVFVDYVWSAVPDANPRGGRFGELLGYEVGEEPIFHMIPDASGRTGGRLLSGDPAVAKLQLFVNGQHPTTRRIAESGRPLEVAGARALSERPGAPTAVRREVLLKTGEHGWRAIRGADGYPELVAPQVGLRSFDVGMAFELDVAPASAREHGAAKVGRAVVVSGLFCNNALMPLFGQFALNVCNWMAERRVLLDLKAPGYEAKYLQLQPQQLDRIHTFVFWGVPGFFLVVGVVVFWLRRRQ